MRMGTSASILSFTYQEAYYHETPTLILCLMTRLCSDGANAYYRATARLKAAAREGKALTIEKRICSPRCLCRTGLRKSYDNEDLDFWF